MEISTNPDVYHLQVTGEQYERQLEGLVSILLAHKKRPVVRHQSTSDSARRLAHGLSVSGAVVVGRIEVHLATHTDENALFTFKRTVRPPLVRRLDPFQC